ncbi:MAG: sigma-70 family RNA polymerase sigma factor [Pirellulaceae bacterium]|nr:sigma-70 family RNA polymerase sigma factor [Planctomycetales bacterium]
MGLAAMSSSVPRRWLGEVRQGDDGHLGALLELYRNYLSLLADSHLDPKLRARVSPSDLVQETMLEAHRDIRQFRGESELEFLGWLRQILVNNLAQVVEKHVLAVKRDVRREVSLEGLRTAVEQSTIHLGQVLAGREEPPHAEMERRERAVILADLLTSLPPHYREVLMMRNLQGLRFDEVARKLNRTVPATKMLWMRAIKQLRQAYDNRFLQ